VDLEIEFKPGVPLRGQLEGAPRVAIRSGRLAPGSVLAPAETWLTNSAYRAVWWSTVTLS
jgi:hypothetical protein